MWPNLSNVRCAVSRRAHHDEHECRSREKKCLLAVLSFLKNLNTVEVKSPESRVPAYIILRSKWFFELDRIFLFSAEVHTLFSAIVIWSIYFLATFRLIVTQKEIKREKCRYEESTSPPMKRQLGVQAISHIMCALVFFASRQKYSRFKPDGFLFLNLLQKPHLT